MKHQTASSFWECDNKLPLNIRHLADKNFQLLKDDHSHTSLQFKKVGKVWSSARIGTHYRAVAIPIKEGFLWIWIGSHTEYDKLLA
ncbi:MAG: hypothetical protein HC877_01545 [Thioploca sp.]|nr:hypothetical protein [Thioploca sp.]